MTAAVSAPYCTIQVRNTTNSLCCDCTSHVPVSDQEGLSASILERLKMGAIANGCHICDCLIVLESIAKTKPRTIHELAWVKVKDLE